VNSTSVDGEKFENYISSAEAARIVGTTTQAMSNLVRKGYFTTKTVADRILVLRSEVESFVPRPKGRPTKKLQAKPKPSKKPLEAIDRENPGKYISQAEAGRIRGVSKQAIADLIHRGRLTTVGVAGRTLVLRTEVEAFDPQPVGHPPKRKTGTKKSKQKR
jgi:predicted DNA-binding protein (UPF0251 family)